MDRTQRTTISWILFATFWVIYVATALSTLAMLFLGFGMVRDDERKILVPAFLVETSAALVALFYAVFDLRKSKNDEVASKPEASPGETESAIQAEPIALAAQHCPEFRLRADGFEGGDDAALETVIAALELAKVTSADRECFALVLPGVDENRARIAELKKLGNRNDQERDELTSRIVTSQDNERALAKLTAAFRIVLQNNLFRESAKLSSAEATWEVLVGLWYQEFRQIPFGQRRILYVSSTATPRLKSDVLLTAEEFESEDSRYLNEEYRAQGLRPGQTYELDVFTPSFVRKRCLSAIALLLAAPTSTSVPPAAYDVRTWRLSQAPAG